jgi:hypothetical protein
MLNLGQQSIDFIACVTGFGERQRMRRASLSPGLRQKDGGRSATSRTWIWNREQAGHFPLIHVWKIIDIPRPAEPIADPTVQQVDAFE